MKKPVAAKPKKSVSPFSVRFDEDERAALEKAAKDDERSVGCIVRRATRDWLKAKGYLK